ncbi:MAG: pyridoxamine 5'-phosphate oxidase family protein [Haloferacaceae archaeon]
MTVDELGEYGLVRMTDDEIRRFLAGRSVGVLGLPAEGAPSMRPMSFAFDGESRLYLLYVLGAESRKAALTARAGTARFLVYSAETAFNWTSVLLAGTLDEVPDREREAALDEVELAWRPDLFERAGDGLTTKLYEFRIDDCTGIEHMGLPPSFEPGPEESAG